MPFLSPKGISYPSGHTEQLTVHQRYMLNYQLCFPHGLLNNMPTLIRLPKNSVDPEKLRFACERVFHAHPSYAMVHSFDENGGIVLKYRPDIIEAVPVIETDEPAFLSNVSALVRPFSLMESRLYRCEIYVGNRNIYLFLDNYHTLSDGSSQIVALREIFSVMNGEACSPDGYLDYLSDCGGRRGTEERKKTENVFGSLYGGKNYSCVPKYDRREEVTRRGTCVRQTGFTQREWEVAAKNRGTTPNRSLVSACLAALSVYNNEKNVMINWAFHGRDTREKKDMTGLLFAALPVGATIGPDTTIRALLDEVREKCEQGKPYARFSPGVADNRPGENDRICIFYQTDLSLPENVPAGSGMSCLYDALTGQVNCFNIIADKRQDPEEPVSLLFIGDLRFYKPESLERFAELFCGFLRRLLLADENENVLEKNK